MEHDKHIEEGSKKHAQNCKKPCSKMRMKQKELAVRPDATGKMRWCGEEDWAKDKPLGSKRISKTWLDNRLAHVLDEGCTINEPNYERIDGAKELSDLIEWDYAQATPLEADMPALEDEDARMGAGW